MPISRPFWILPVIVCAAFAGSSIWFASNAVLGDIQQAWGISASALGHVTTAVQFGFIAGTLAFAVFAISDRFSPRWVFFYCCLLGALANLASGFIADDFYSLLVYRVLTGFFLAGIYPIGMKIAAGWYRADLGKAIGYLVGALVLGTAFPHLLKGFALEHDWRMLLASISGVAACGGLLMLALVPDGPFLSKIPAKFDPRALAAVFKLPAFRASALGYFGHMWELYALWAFVPVALTVYGVSNIALWSFIIIAVGSAGCAGGGLLSLHFGSARVAFVQLAVSGLCCLLSPLLFDAPITVFLVFWIIWGIAVAGDSPQFSAMNARYAPTQLVGSSLTIVNCIGFSITIVSIQMVNYLVEIVDPKFVFLTLAVGPMLGLLALRPLLQPIREDR